MRILLSLALAACFACQAADAPFPESPDAVLVQRGDIKITVGDFMAYLEKVPEAERFAFRSDMEKINSVISNLFITRSLAEEARKEGVDKDPIIQLRVRQSEDAILSQSLMAKFEKSIVTPDFEARALEIYKASPERYERPARVQVRRIIASSQGRTDEESRRWAQQAYDKLKAGAQPPQVVREFSSDLVSLRDDGVFEGEYRAFPDAVAAAIRTAPLNQPIGPTNTGRGYEVDIVMDRFPAQATPFEKAKASIIEGEKAKYRKEKVNEKLGTVTNSKDVHIYTDAIAPLEVKVDRDLLHKMHVEKAKQNADAKAKREQEDAATQAAAKGKGG